MMTVVEGLEIRQIVTRDLPLMSQYFWQPVSKNTERMLARKKGRLWAAELDGDTVGWVLTEVRRSGRSGGPIGYVQELQVQSNYRRRGVGRALMEFVETYYAFSGCEAIELSVELNNASARNLYEKLGYKTFALRLTKHLDSEGS